MRRSLKATVAVAGLLTLPACVDAPGPTGIARAGSVGLLVAPRFAAATTEPDLAALDVVRITLRDPATDGLLLPPVEAEIEPGDSEWSFEVRLELTPMQILPLYLEAEISDTDPEPESVEWSGRTAAFEVRASIEPLELHLIDLFRGPLANLGLERVTLATPTLRLLQGGSAQLEWSVEGDTDGTVLYFASRNPEVATVDAGGRVRTHAAGSTRLVIFGGQVQDSLTLNVEEVVLPEMPEIEEVVVPHLEYVSGELFLSTFEDATGAALLRGLVSSLEEALRTLDGPAAVAHFEEAVAAWESYGEGTDLRRRDGPQLGVLELGLILVADKLHAQFP